MGIKKIFLVGILFFGLHALHAFDSDSSNDSCSGELLDKLDTIATTTSFTGNGKLKSWDFLDYYYFAPGVAGTYTITLDATIVDMKAGNSCGTETHFRDISSNTTKIQNVKVAANESLYLTLFDNGEDFWSFLDSRPYDLGITFTPALLEPKADYFPSPVNSNGGQVILQSGVQINGTTSNLVTTSNILDNGASCDGGTCGKSNTTVPVYAFTPDTGDGSDGAGVAGATYSANQAFTAITLNASEEVSFSGDLTIRVQNRFELGGKLHINGNVTLYVDTFEQLSGSLIDIQSGSLTMITNSAILDENNAIFPNTFTVASGDITVNDNTTLSGLLYANNALSVGADTEITGAITGNSVTVNTNGVINYASVGTETEVMIAVMDAFPVFEGNDGNKSMTFNLLLDHADTSNDITIHYQTEAATAEDESGNNDFWHNSGSLTIQKGSTSATITVNVDGDFQDEANEEFYLILDSASSGVIVDNNATGEILDDDLYDNTNHYYCDTQVFVYSSDPYDALGNRVFTNPTDSSRVDLMTKTNTPEAIGFYGDNINAIGYSVSDNFIWGYDLGAFKLTRTDINHNVISYDIANMEPYYFHIGDVSMDGILYLGMAYLKTYHNVEKDGLLRMYRVDVNPNSHFFLKKRPSIDLDDQSFMTADWAFNPIDKQLYFVNRYDFELVRIDPQTGKTKKLGTLLPFYNKDSGSHVQFFDKDGYFYFYWSSDVNDLSKGDFYRVDIRDTANPAMTVEKYTYLPLPANGDAARCAYAPIHTKISAMDKATYEGNVTNPIMQFDFTLDNPAPAGGIDVTYSTLDHTAIAGSDYIGVTNKVISVSAGLKLVQVPVEIIGDKDLELDETFDINITNVSLGVIDDGIARGTIQNDDTLPISVNAVDYTTVFDWDKNITTKISGKYFDLTILAKYDSNNSAVVDLNITGVELVSCDGTTLIEGWKTFSPALTTDVNGMLHISGLRYNYGVSKCAKVKIYSNFNGQTYNNFSEDNFAVRPDHFEIILPPKATTTEPIHADETFVLTFEARDPGGMAIPGYDELKGSSFDITYREHNESINCKTGLMDLTDTNFTNGWILKTTSYSENGLVDINISEINTTAFAIIDIDDTPMEDLLITPHSVLLPIIADKFNVDWSMISGDSSGQTYFSTDASTHGGLLDINISARSNTDRILKNFHGGCYATDTNVSFEYYLLDNDSDTFTMTAYDKNASTNGVISTTPTNGVLNVISLNLDDTTFVEGVRHLPLYLNFERNVSQPMNPVNFKVTKVSAVSGTIPGVLERNDQLLSFYFARAYVASQLSETSVHRARVDYEVYCKTCDRSKFPKIMTESSESVNWFILPNVSFSCDIGNVVNSYHDNDMNVSKISNREIEVSVNTLPYKSSVVYTPAPYLVYNQFNPNANTHRFSVNFVSTATQWSGKGVQGAIIDGNISAKTIKKMEW